MSEPGTFGSLMVEAVARHDAAQWRIITTRFVDDVAARGAVAARAAMVRALREQVAMIREFPSLDQLRSTEYVAGQEHYRYYRPATPGEEFMRNNFYTAREVARGRSFVPARVLAIERWFAATDSILECAPEDDGSPSPAADRYREATQLIRAASDLLDTHRTVESVPRKSPQFGASRPALELAAAATDGSHFLMTRAHQAGVRAKEIRSWLPVGQDVELHDASEALLTFTPATPGELPATRLAGTVRTDTLAHEWSDRIDRVAARLERLATSTEVNVRTMGYVAFVALANDRLTGGRDAEQWRAVVDQLREWKGVSPSDPRIAEDQRRLRAIALQISADPRSAMTRDVVAAAMLSRAAVDGMARTANTIMDDVRRWVPAERTTTPAYLQEVKVGAALAKFAPKAPALVWPTSTDPLAL